MFLNRTYTLNYKQEGEEYIGTIKMYHLTMVHLSLMTRQSMMLNYTHSMVQHQNNYYLNDERGHRGDTREEETVYAYTEL